MAPTLQRKKVLKNFSSISITEEEDDDEKGKV